MSRCHVYLRDTCYFPPMPVTSVETQKNSPNVALEAIEKVDVEKRLKAYLAAPEKEKKVQQLAPIMEKLLEAGYLVKKNEQGKFYVEKNGNDPKILSTMAYINPVLAKMQDAKRNEIAKAANNSGDAYDLNAVFSETFIDKLTDPDLLRAQKGAAQGTGPIEELLATIDDSRLTVQQKTELVRARVEIDQALRDVQATQQQTQKDVAVGGEMVEGALQTLIYGTSALVSGATGLGTNAVAKTPGSVIAGSAAGAEWAGDPVKGIKDGTANIAAGIANGGLWSMVNSGPKFLSGAMFAGFMLFGGKGKFANFMKILTGGTFLYQNATMNRSPLRDGANWFSRLLGVDPGTRVTRSPHADNPKAAPSLTEKEQLLQENAGDIASLEKAGLSKEDAEIIALYLDAPMSQILSMVQIDTKKKLENPDSRWDVVVDPLAGNLLSAEQKEHIKKGTGGVTEAQMKSAVSNLLSQVGSEWKQEIIEKEGNAFVQDRTNEYLGHRVLQRLFAPDMKKELSNHAQQYINPNTNLVTAISLVLEGPKATNARADKQMEAVQREISQLYKQDRRLPEEATTWGEYIREQEKKASKSAPEAKRTQAEAPARPSTTETSASRPKSTTTTAQPEVVTQKVTLEEIQEQLKAEGFYTKEEIRKIAGLMTGMALTTLERESTRVVLLLRQNGGVEMAEKHLRKIAPQLKSVPGVDERRALNTMLLRVSQDQKMYGYEDKLLALKSQF